jgi:hypothetical protein
MSFDVLLATVQGTSDATVGCSKSRNVEIVVILLR